MEEQERRIEKAEEAVATVQKQMAALAHDWVDLRKRLPPVAAKRARRIRLAFEVAGLTIAATGAWWIYPPAALLLVGAWLLGDIIVSRRVKKNA